MSKELIDRKQIHYVWVVDADGEEHDGVTLQSIIKKMPTVDAVEVVRCSECQHWGGVTFGFICRKFSGENTKICMHADDYCSYGEQLEADGDKNG